MAIATLYSNIYDAIQLQSQWSSAYLVIGKTTPWTDDNNPPDEDPNVTEISEVIGYRKVKQFSLARPLSPTETADNAPYPVVSYGDKEWVLIPVDKAYEEKAHYVYIEAEVKPDELPLGPYRQVGIHVNLVPKDGVTKQNLLPSEVKDPGILRFYENREPQNRTSSVTVQEQFMVEV
ncbi:baseplate protein [Bacillus phage 015DV002]|nr:baseplate protein [Bacillus phage 000TH008]QQO40855.1 baseplate protein [Bacillus phage 000TH009]QQO41106.1 baseplate protein [Bacillus phage 015DV002]QQO41383.1 baseplate protein [Bacillus phage 015DV004]